MSTYNLMRRADRDRLRADRQAEIDAIDAGEWPRDTDDLLRWGADRSFNDHRGHAALARDLCATTIAYLDDLQERIGAGDPDVKDWELCSDGPTPYAVLTQHAMLLTEQTEGEIQVRLRGESVPGLNGGVQFEVEVPKLDYRHGLLSLRFVKGHDDYPVEVESECLRLHGLCEVGQVYPVAVDAGSLRLLLNGVFAHERTISLIGRLLDEVRNRHED